MSAYIDSQRTTVEKLGNLFLEAQSSLPNHQLNHLNPSDGKGFSELYDFGKLCVGKGKYWLSDFFEMTAEAPIQSFGMTILLSGTHHFFNHQTGQNFELKSPALILRRGNIGKQTIFLQKQTDMSLITLDFDQNLLHTFDSISLDNELAHFYTHSNLPKIKSIALNNNNVILHQAHYLLNLKPAKNTIDLMHLEGAALELLSLIIHQHNRVNSVPESIQKTIRILKTNFQNKITIRGLAREVGINECDLKKLFKLHTQNTIGSYLLIVRMEHAQLLLKEGKKLDFVAQAVGYDNPQYFKKVFQGFFGYQF